MALQIYNSNSIGSGIQANLGTTDDVYIGADGFLGSTTTSGVYGTGSNHSVTVEGSIIAFNEAIFVGNDPSADFGQEVLIGENAVLVSANDYGIRLQGYGSSIENNGLIEGYNGIYSSGDATSGLSTLVNSGEIHTANAAVVRVGSENFQFANNGTVSAESGIAYQGNLASGNQTLVNNGRISGLVILGDGNDIYSGINGKITDGAIFGLDGNDMFVGGKYAEFFVGGARRDILKGNGGADCFIFTDTADSTNAKAGRDLIQDFNHTQHDRLDLSSIDAEASSSGTDEIFAFIGADDFSGAEGELRYKFIGASTLVQGDTDGDKNADFSIELKGHIALHAGDFML
jgi:Ca2+-binding RTX toxin-like protein